MNENVLSDVVVEGDDSVTPLCKTGKQGRLPLRQEAFSQASLFAKILFSGSISCPLPGLTRWRLPTWLYQIL